MRSQSIGQVRRRWQWCISILVMLALPGVAAAAVQQIRVLGVGVANSSTQAEALAIDYAKKRAAYLVARKLQVENASDKLAVLSPDTYNKIIRGATVMNTRRDKEITYIDVVVSVVDTELRRALDVPDTTVLAETPPQAVRNILVLPLYRDEQRAYLWEEKNPLAEPLRSEVLRQSHGTVMLPAGDFEDLRLIDHANAPTVRGAELAPMFTRYGADEIIIVEVTPAAVQTDGPTQILLRRLTPQGERREAMRVVPADANERVELRVATAANTAAAAIVQIANATADEDRAELSQATQIPIFFEYANPRELAQMQQAVRTAAGVLLLRMPAIGLQTMQGTVYLKGERQALRTTLVKQGILVAEKEGRWVLSLR